LILATWKNGQIVPDGLVDLPEGCRLAVEPESETIGVTEEEWDNSPEGIAAWLEWYRSLEPLIFTPEEEADIAQWRQKVKDYTIASMHKGIEDLWE